MECLSPNRTLMTHFLHPRLRRYAKGRDRKVVRDTGLSAVKQCLLIRYIVPENSQHIWLDNCIRTHRSTARTLGIVGLIMPYPSLKR